MKKSITILLTVCMLLSVFGSGTLYWLKTYEAKKQMLAYLRTCALDKTTVIQLEDGNTNNPNIQWEGDDEFKWNGTMYDVVKTERKGNKQLIYCVADGKETELQIQISKQQSSQNTKQLKALKLFPVFCPLITAVVVNQQQLITVKHGYNYCVRLTETNKPIDGPPPQVFYC